MFVAKEPVAPRAIAQFLNRSQGPHLTPGLEVSRLVEQWVDGHAGAAVALLPLRMPTHPKESKLLCLSDVGSRSASTP